MATTLSEHAAKGEEAGVGESSEAPPFLGSDQLLLYRGLKKARKERGCTAKDRISKMPPCTAGKRSSIYRGVTRHRWTGRYEAHLWDKSTWNENQNKKGKQVYLGAYDDEEAAARAYDLAALKYWGPGTLINFPVKHYARDLEEMQNVSREEYLGSLRRKSSGFARGMSKYRPLSSRWDSPLGRILGRDNVNGEFFDAGDEMGTTPEYASGYCTARKIDLSNYIKWWGPNGSSQSDFRPKALDETDLGSPDAAASELKALEWSVKPTDAYEMPRLGVPPDKLKQKKISAMSILMKSPAYNSLQEKISKAKEEKENGEKDNKNTIHKIELPEEASKSCHNGGSERLCVSFGMGGELHLESDTYALAPFLSAPLITNYNTIDPLTDPSVWSSLIPALPTGSSHTNEV